MSDVAVLAKWLQPQHLTEQESYHDSFHAHPARMIVLREFLLDSVAERLSTFLQSEAEFQPEYGLHSLENQAVPASQWEHAAEEDRFFRMSKISGAQNPMSPNLLTYVQFRTALKDPAFRHFFSQISGMELGWSDDFGSHCMEVGDFLKPHSDDNRNRQLALVLYLSPAWKTTYGGALKVVDRNGEVTTIEPIYNSMVVFDVAAGSSHSVAPITAAAGTRARLSIGGWFHKPD